MSIDYDQFNTAAQTVYETAFERGRQRGIMDEQGRIAEAHRRAMVDLAVNLLRSSQVARDKFEPRESHTRREEHWPERVLAGYARMVLGRTPLSPDVDRALGTLRHANLNNAPGDIDRKGVDEALSGLEVYLEHLGGYR